MLFLIEVSFRQGVRPEEGRPAATMLRDRLQKPATGIKILNSVADIGGSKIVVLADLSDEAMNDLRYTLEFRTLVAVERITYTPVVDAKATLDAYLGI
jgi:hypothetical protein